MSISDDPSVVGPIFQELKQNLKSRETYSIEYRKKTLLKLMEGYEKLKPEFDEAIKKDLGMNAFMSNFLSHGVTMPELKHMYENL